MKSKSLNIWKEMSLRSRVRLAFAVFLMFSALGPITLLMESKLHLISWETFLLQSIGSGGLAASIILSVRRKWLIIIFILFWGAIMFVGSGGLSISVRGGSAQTVIGKIDETSVTTSAKQLEDLTPQRLDNIFTQRTQIGLIAIALIAFGYTSFIVVIKQEIKERARLQTEMAITQTIQQSLLPRDPLVTPKCSINGITVPATEVAGDYYDFIQLTDSTIAVLIADVSGHGVGSGILSAMTKSAFYSEIQHTSEPSQLLQALNSTLYEVSSEKMFVTVAYIVLNTETGKAKLATAGHPPILYIDRSSQVIKEFRTPNIALGMKKNVSFSELEISLKKGDAFILYTDGVTEASNAKKEQFGAERLSSFLLSSNDTPRHECNRIIVELQTFTKEKSFADDVTVVSIQLT